MPPPITFIEFIDGTMWPIFEEVAGQFVLDDDGEPVFGIWIVPRADECDSPIFVGPCLDDF